MTVIKASEAYQVNKKIMLVEGTSGRCMPFLSTDVLISVLDKMGMYDAAWEIRSLVTEAKVELIEWKGSR